MKEFVLKNNKSNFKTTTKYTIVVADKKNIGDKKKMNYAYNNVN